MKMKNHLIALCILILFAGCTSKGARDSARPSYNVILISIDTLRPDHLGCYGYKRNLSPNIDAFAKDAVRFNTVISQAPSTAPSHASIFTSMIPSSHGAFYSMKTPISKNLTTMSELMKTNGYNTASFNGGGQLSSDFGFARGFDIYSSNTEKKTQGSDFLSKVTNASSWLDQNQGKFFLFLHTYEVHMPYRPESEYLESFESNYSGTMPKDRCKMSLEMSKGQIKLSQEDYAHIVNTYDASIMSMDKSFGRFMAYLKSNNLYNNSIIILTADHGEEFGEHGWWAYHSHTLYDELLKVPLIIKIPSISPAVVDSQVRSIDILPTVADALGIAKDGNWQGTNLIGYMDGSSTQDLVAISQRDTKGDTHPAAVRTKEFKLNDGKLYNILEDHQEKEDVAKQNPGTMKDLQNELDEALTKRISGKSERVAIDNDTERQLRSLGYLN